MRTRLWEDPEGVSSTCVQFRTDVTPMVYVHTNIGWIPIGNTPEDEVEAERFAEEIAKGYDLEESGRDRALFMAGMEDSSERNAM